MPSLSVLNTLPSVWTEAETQIIMLDDIHFRFSSHTPQQTLVSDSGTRKPWLLAARYVAREISARVKRYHS
jgi:hypothetical protein